MSLVALRVGVYVPCFAIGALWLARTERLDSPLGVAIVALVCAAITGFAEAVLARRGTRSGAATQEGRATDERASG